MVNDNGVITLGGKTDNAHIPPNLMAKLHRIFGMIDGCGAKLIETFPKGACLYGEGFGYKIQGKVGIDYLKDDVDFYLFDIKVGDYWLKRETVAEIGSALGLILPNVVAYMTIDEAIDLVATGFKSSFGTADAEGLVLRPKVELLNRKGERIITKIKHRDFA